MPHVRVRALAKVNLDLRVLGPRPDGYHEIRTVFQTISLSDRLEIEYHPGRRRTVDLSCTLPGLEGPDNLASRAAVSLLDATRAPGGVRIHLDKRIPAGAGLGGGSSDAAAVLRALASLLRPRPNFDLLRKLAAGLGSDVPFFLVGGRALGIGRGAEVYRLPDAPPRWLLVAAPPFAVSTAEAYRRLGAQLTSGSGNDKIDRFCSRVCAAERGAVAGWAPDPENDFENVVFQMHPELRRLKARLKQLGARPALLCGSGSAVFGVFSDRRQAARARQSLEPKVGDCFVVKTVSRTECLARWRRWLGEAGG